MQAAMVRFHFAFRGLNFFFPSTALHNDVSRCSIFSVFLFSVKVKVGRRVLNFKRQVTQKGRWTFFFFLYGYYGLRKLPSRGTNFLTQNIVGDYSLYTVQDWFNGLVNESCKRSGKMLLNHIFSRFYSSYYSFINARRKTSCSIFVNSKWQTQAPKSVLETREKYNFNSLAYIICSKCSISRKTAW